MSPRELRPILNEAVVVNRPSEDAQAGAGRNHNNPARTSGPGDSVTELKHKVERLQRRLKHRAEVNSILETTIKNLEAANASFESAYTSLDETNRVLEQTITGLEEEVLVAAREQRKTKALLDEVVLVVNTLGDTEVQSAVEVTIKLGSCY